MVIGSLIFAVAMHGATAVPELRRNGPEITNEAARKMSASELGDALLAPGHPLIVEALVHPAGMEPPLPPGAAYRIGLGAHPEWDDSLGVCAMAVYDIMVEQVFSTDTGVSSARLYQIDATTVYRLPDDNALPGQRCGAAASYFALFKVDDLVMAHLLNAARQQARGSGPLRFSITLEDRMADDLPQFYSKNPELAGRHSLKRFQDARAALSALPITSITSIDSDDLESPFREAEIVNTCSSLMSCVTIKLGGEWVVGVALANNQIVRMKIVRRTPPPF